MSEVWLVFNDARSHQGNMSRSLKWQAYVCNTEKRSLRNILAILLNQFLKFMYEGF